MSLGTHRLQAAEETDSPGDQIVHALRYLYEHARTPLEGLVFLTACSLCSDMPKTGFEKQASKHSEAKLEWRKIDAEFPMSALQYLQAEARHHNLEATESVLIATLSLWMIAGDIEMVRALIDEPKAKH